MDDKKINDTNFKSLEKRVEKLEGYREKDKTQIYELDKSLNIFINELKNISDELKTIVSNFKEAIAVTTTAQEKEITCLKDKVIKNEKSIEKLSIKLDKETVEADATKWKDISKYIITTLIGAVITFLLIQIGLK